jgi:hypothetical protein
MSFLISTPARFGPTARFLQLSRQLELPQTVIPHPHKNLSGRPQRFAASPIVPVSLLRAHLDDAGLHKRPQLKRNRSERNVRHRTMDCSGCLFYIPNQAQNLSPARGGDHIENGWLHRK